MWFKVKVSCVAIYYIQETRGLRRSQRGRKSEHSPRRCLLRYKGNQRLRTTNRLLYTYLPITSKRYYLDHRHFNLHQPTICIERWPPILSVKFLKVRKCVWKHAHYMYLHVCVCVCALEVWYHIQGACLNTKYWASVFCDKIRIRTRVLVGTKP